MSNPEPLRATVLIVDDTPANLALLNGLLKNHYRIKVANHGSKALELALAEPPDLILLDIMMPDMDGYEVCRRLQAMATTRRVPVIFLTAKTSTEDEKLGFSVGAVDFIHKPISPPIVAARVKTHLAIKASQDKLQNQNIWLENEVKRRLSEINRLQDASIYVMVSLAEFRDECTGNHIRRTQAYVRLLARRLAQLPAYADVLTDDQIALLEKSAPLHDIGKITIPDHILLKPGKHTVEEFAIMKTHARRGFDLLKQAGDFIGDSGAFLAIAQEIALSHHEKWDGSGYPEQLQGQTIPLAARLMAVADVYDALRSERPYKKVFSHAEAAALIREQKGRHFDPDVVDAFFTVEQEFIKVAEQWSDQQVSAQIRELP